MSDQSKPEKLSEAQWASLTDEQRYAWARAAQRNPMAGVELPPAEYQQMVADRWRRDRARRERAIRSRW